MVRIILSLKVRMRKRQEVLEIKKEEFFNGKPKFIISL